MNTTNASIHPGLKAMIAGCSLALMSAFVWYSHIQAQSKSVPVNVAAQSVDAAETANTTSDAPQPPPKQSRTILLSGSKSYTGSTTLNAGTLAPPLAPTPPNEPKPPILMPGSKVGIITTTMLPSIPPPSFTSQQPTEQQRAILMLGSKSTAGTIFIQPGTLNELGIDPFPKANNAQPQSKDTPANLPRPEEQKRILMSGSKSMVLTTSNPAPVSKDSKNPSQPIQAVGKSPQPEKPKDVLMFGTKAPAMPLVGTERTEKPMTQKAAPPAQQQKSVQK